MLRKFLHKLIREEDGVLSFEWALLATLLTIGIVTGLAAARDGIVDELGDAAQAMLAVDGSFRIDAPLELTLDGVSPGGASDSQYTDFALFTDCDRTTEIPGAQTGESDGPS
jgi:Flp pilus assembly pilin Flp